jgi:hypothetical protein
MGSFRDCPVPSKLMIFRLRSGLWPIAANCTHKKGYERLTGIAGERWLVALVWALLDHWAIAINVGGTASPRAFNT